MRAGLVVAMALSLLVHGLVAGGVALLARPLARERAKELPLELLPAPTPPPPPKMPEPAPPAPAPPPPAKPKPRPPRKPRVVAAVVDAGADAAIMPDAGPDAAPGDAGPGDAGADGPVGDAGADAQLADGGTDAAAGDAGLDAGVGVPVDPGVVDLRPFLPPGERVMLVLRTDRLRGTPWAARLEAVVAPMPDHRLVIDGTGLGIVETFDTVVISSADARDVTRTFLAARSPLDEGALRRALAKPAPGVPGPRLRWRGDVAERLDPRVARIGDPRKLLIALPGWFLLVRPEHLEESRRAWLEALARIDEQTGTGPTVAVVMVANLGTPTLAVPIPGLPPLPAPDRLTIAVTVDRAGLVLTGAAVFPDEAAAAGFVSALEAARVQALGSFAGKVLLRSFHVEGAVTRLAFTRDGAAVTFATSLANDEGDGLLTVLADMSRRFFLGESPK